MNSIVWINDDCLSLSNPALAKYPEAPALFVFDPKWTETVTLKRIQFVYECLLELPVTIFKGDPVETISAFACQHQATHVVSTATPDPRLQQVLTGLNSMAMTTEILEVEPFVAVKGRVDLKRFSQYWKRIQAAAFEAE
jgi:hypothetical protein